MFSLHRRAMSSHTFEIVHFAFRPEVPLADQRAWMARVGAFAARAPGFVRRSYYRAEDSGRWVDLVVWTDAAHAKAAAETLMADPELGPTMALLDEASISFGHYHQEG